MEEDVQVLKGVSSHILNIFLSEDLVRIEEADLIEGQNREHQINLKIFRLAGSSGSAIFYVQNFCLLHMEPESYLLRL